MAAPNNPKVPHPAARADISDGYHTCIKCGERKPLAEFSKRKSRPLGVKSACKVCDKIANRLHYCANLDKNREYARVYRRENAEVVAAQQAVYRDANREVLREYHRQYAKDNPSAVLAKIARRRAQKLLAAPTWANPVKVQGFYSALRFLGAGWHVDHIVPLSSPLVCGLHCEANLRIIRAEDNLRKGNRVWPDMP